MLRREERRRREELVRAWQTANFQGLAWAKLQPLLDGEAPQAPRRQTAQEMYDAMSQWIAVQNGVAAAQAANPVRHPSR